MQTATAVAVERIATIPTVKTKPFRPARRLPAIRPTALLRYRDIRIACNLQCVSCSRVFRTPQGLGSHLWFIHGVRGGRAQYGANWVITNKQATITKKTLPVARFKKGA
jgi:hypothetical protein